MYKIYISISIIIYYYKTLILSQISQIFWAMLSQYCFIENNIIFADNRFFVKSNYQNIFYSMYLNFFLILKRNI